jgi:hypothetical protein
MDFHCPRAIFKDTLILGSEPNYHTIHNLGGLMQYLAILDVEANRHLLPIHNLVGHASVVGIQFKSFLDKTLDKLCSIIAPPP